MSSQSQQRQQQQLHKRPSSAPSGNINSNGVQVTVTTNSNVTNSGANANQTPPGWNSGRRYVARGVLWLVVLTLMGGKKVWATILSALSIIILKEGTLFSGKNIKWMLISGISFLASLGSWSLERAYEVVDEDKAYHMKISLWLASRSIQGVWGIILVVFLFSAATGKSSAPTTPTAVLAPAVSH